jgi:small Trp-rich protein
MYFVILGTLLVVLKLADVGFAAKLSWLWVLAPFLAAVLWWAWADASGLTKRREMRRLQERQQKRRERDIAALGLGARGEDGKRATPGAARRGKPRE